MRCIVLNGWLPGQTKTVKPIASKFGDYAMRTLLSDLETELARWGVHHSTITVASELPVGKSGFFINGWRPGDEHGVIVYWKKKDAPYCIAVDRYDRPEDNLRAIIKSIEALRALERWGGDRLAEQAMQGFKELPGSAARGSCWDTLGVSPNATRDEIEKAFRKAALKNHPDHGGSDEGMAKVNAARDEALELANA